MFRRPARERADLRGSSQGYAGQTPTLQLARDPERRTQHNTTQSKSSQAHKKTTAGKPRPHCLFSDQPSRTPEVIAPKSGRLAKGLRGGKGPGVRGAPVRGGGVRASRKQAMHPSGIRHFGGCCDSGDIRYFGTVS